MYKAKSLVELTFPEFYYDKPMCVNTYIAFLLLQQNRNLLYYIKMQICCSKLFIIHKPIQIYIYIH